MKRNIAVAGLIAVALTAHSASAKTLEDVLKEKGVITEGDYNEIVKTTPKSKPVNYKPGSGFSFTSADEKFQLTVGGQLQGRYTFTEKGADAQANSSEWRLRRAKTLFSGYAFSRDLTFKFNQNWASLGTFNKDNYTLNAAASPITANINTNTSTVLEETYVNYRILDGLQVRVGQDKVLYARQWITSSTQDQFVDNAFVTDAFRPSYDTGLAVNGSINDGLLTYAVQWLGGKGQNIPQATNNNAVNVRFAVNPLGDVKYSESDLAGSDKPLVSVGASYFHDTLKRNNDPTKAVANGFDNNNLNFTGSSGWLGLKNNVNQFGTTANVNINSFETDVAFKWKGISLQGEYFWAEGNGAGAAAGTTATVVSRGFYTQAGAFVVPKTVELAARYAWMDYNTGRNDSLKSEFQGAVSWYIDGHNLKLQGDITKSYAQNYIDSRAKAAGSLVNDTVFRAQAQLLF